MMSLKDKLMSRKFWITVAEFIGGIAFAIKGMQSDNDILMFVGIVCAALSAWIYAICETTIDASAVYLQEEDDSECIEDNENEED